MEGWIKMRTNLHRHPKVVTLALRLSVTPVTVVGALHALWSLADEYAVGNVLPLYTDAVVDNTVRIDGFCKALEVVEWIKILDEGGLQLPNYEEHNGPSAKSRAQANRRVTKHRYNCNADAVTKPLPDKIRLDKSTVPPCTPPDGGQAKRSASPTLPEVLAEGMALDLPKIEAEKFFDHFTSNGWKVGGRGVMRDWKAALRNWQRNADNFKHVPRHGVLSSPRQPELGADEILRRRITEDERLACEREASRHADPVPVAGATKGWGQV